MKLITHDITSITLSLITIQPDSITKILTIIATSYFTNRLIDYTGHTKRITPLGTKYIRNPIHSPFIGIISGLLQVFIFPSYIWIAYIISYLLHLLLDIITENGIYLLYPFKKKRYKILRLKYNSIANEIIQGISILILIMSIKK